MIWVKVIADQGEYTWVNIMQVEVITRSRPHDNVKLTIGDKVYYVFDPEEVMKTMQKMNATL